MALQPTNFNTRRTLQPGADGSMFQADIPGYRNGEDRVNRTNMRFVAGDHDVPNIKYELDYRLPTLFRYGYAFGYNQLVIPKGRIVAVDTNMDLVDFDTKHAWNTITLANGGTPVRVRENTDVYKDYAGESTKLVSTEGQGKATTAIGKEWIPLQGMDKAYSDFAYRPFKEKLPKEILAEAKYEVDAETGKIVDSATKTERVNVRCGNIPIGVIVSSWGGTRVEGWTNK